MKRNIFFLSLISLLLIGITLINTEVRGYSFIVLFLGSIIAILRRKYLNLKPWWGGRLRDIPKYFKLP